MFVIHFSIVFNKNFNFLNIISNPNSIFKKRAVLLGGLGVPTHPTADISEMVQQWALLLEVNFRSFTIFFMVPLSNDNRFFPILDKQFLLL